MRNGIRAYLQEGYETPEAMSSGDNDDEDVQQAAEADASPVVTLPSGDRVIKLANGSYRYADQASSDRNTPGVRRIDDGWSTRPIAANETEPPQPETVPGMIGVRRSDAGIGPTLGMAPDAIPDLTPTVNAPPPRPSPLELAYEKYGQHLESDPRPEMRHPKWWQRVLAAGVGGAAGFTNAASRIRNPLDIGAAQENLLHPGYAGKLAEWQSRLAPLQQQVELEGQKAAAGWKGQQIQSEQQLKAAQSQAAIDRGAYWRKRAETESNHFKFDGKGNVLDTRTGELVSKRNPTVKDYYDEAVNLGVNPAEARTYALGRASGGHYTVPKPARPQTEAELRGAAAAGDPEAQKAIKAWDDERARTTREGRNPPDPLAELARQTLIDKRINDDLDAIGRKKSDNERDIKYKRLTTINAIKANANVPNQADKDAMIAEANRVAAAALQNVENEYRGEARRRGTQSNNVVVDPVTLEYREQQQAPQQRQAPAPAQDSVNHPQAQPPAHKPQQGDEDPIRVTLPPGPDGKVKIKVFPNKRALDAFAAEAGLTFTPHQ